MKQLSKLYFIIAAVVALSWFLPWLYDLSFPDTGRAPFVQYSPLADSWIVSEFVENQTDPVIYAVDKVGSVQGQYTVEERDSLLPQIYYSRLMAKGLMPDSIAGVEVTMPMLRHNEMVLSVSPRNFVRVDPKVWLIMESMPARFSLEDPKDAFRLTDDGRVEFITIGTNSINEERSRRFTDAFAKNGFRYPAKWLNANVTTRKAYDNGYLIIDDGGDIFHMKQQAGRPYMTRISMPDEEKARYAFVMEGMNRDDLGLVVAESGHVFRLFSDYTLQPVPDMTFNADSQRLMVIGNLFNRVYRVGSDTEITWYAVDMQSGELLDKYSYIMPKQLSVEIAGWIFPFRLEMTSGYDSLAYPRITCVSPKALVSGAICAIIICFVYRRRRMTVKETVFAGVVTILLGIFAIIPLLLIKK
ncbi:MAG: DUF4857 domain-containing protein [Muribaculum sp.]|nr:DUF4857 domain-containing protein [Muribaculum sp.]